MTRLVVRSVGSPSVAGRGITAIIATVWREHALAAALVVLSNAVILLLDLTVHSGIAAPVGNWWTGVYLVELTPLLVLPAVTWHRLVRHQSWHTITTAGPAAPVRLVGLATALLLTRAVVINAVAWKTAIPWLHPFAFDARLSALDRWLHHGDPWRWLQAFTTPGWLRVIDAFYALWYAAFFAVIVAWSWAPPSRRRRQFLVAMMLTWILGSLAGVAISSAGPAYFGRVAGQPDPYVELRARMASVPLAATILQAKLWAAYLHPSSTYAKGIAAFPSLHVALPALYAVSTPRRLRWLCWAWWGVTIITIVGSIVLGWHYAVDGYAGVLLAAACWWTAGRLTRPLLYPKSNADSPVALR